MDRLSIYLLGPFDVQLGDKSLARAFRTRKERALLAYLAVEQRQQHRREAVAELLWPERPEGYARTNLRQALLGLRRAIGEGFIRVSDEMIQVEPSQTIWLDADAFRTSYRQTLSHAHRSVDSCPECANSLQAAVEFYRGDFMADVYLGDAQGFQEWCVFNREQHFRYLLSSLQSLSAFHQGKRDYELAHQYAWRYVNLAPLEEAAHRQLMTVLALSGRRTAALEQFHACSSLLSKELAVETSAETQALYEKIRDGKPVIEAPGSGSLRIPNNLPAGLTSIFGRDDELDALDDCLVKPACRLITLVGMPGAGKTRLALQTARQRLDSFPDGVWYTAPGSRHPEGTLADKLLASQGITVQLQLSPKEQLLTRLRSMRCLLVLDNFELHLDETGLLIELLQHAPRVKILLTTQERLNYQAACVFQIAGLPCGEAPPTGAAHETPSVNLFLARAQHSRSGFTLSDENAGYIADICRKVEGLPLAIELAAAALRDHRCEEIAASLDEGLGMLSTSMLDVPAVHRSMRSAFERPWGRLSRGQQDLIVRLASCTGEFTPSESGASQAELDELLDRSLLETRAPGRFRMHPLVRLFLLEKTASSNALLTPGPAELPGRHMFWDRLEHMLARARRYAQTAAVILLTTADVGGQADMAGSQDQKVLRQLLRCLRKSDTAVLLDRGLYGIILEDLSRAEDSLLVGDKFTKALSPSPGSDDPMMPRFHMGISIYPRDGQEARMLVERAESAMQQAAETGECCRMYGGIESRE